MPGEPARQFPPARFWNTSPVAKTYKDKRSNTKNLREEVMNLVIEVTGWLAEQPRRTTPHLPPERHQVEPKNTVKQT